MIDKLKKVLDLPADLVEVRAVENRNNLVIAKKGEMDTVVSGELSVFSVRVLNKGSFGFATTNDLNTINEVAKKALKLSKLSQKRSLETEMSEEKVYKDKVKNKSKKNILDISLEDKAKDILEINKSMKTDKRIIGYDTFYSGANFDTYYLSSEGAEITFSSDIGKISYSAYAKDKTLQHVFEAFGGLSGYELVEEHRKDAAKISARALKLLDSTRAKPAVYDVVIAPKMTGVFSHEAIGHACEADHIMTGESILKDRLGKRIGSELVSIYDDPRGRYNGSFPYDDEGVKSKKKYMLKDGILESYLHSRETAGKLKTDSTGNSRAQSPLHFPLVRMSNVVFEPRDASFDEITDLKNGLYVDGFKGGQVDTTSGAYQFAAEIGYMIENGELTKTVRDVVIIGDILTTMKNIDMVGKKQKLNFPGTCGKGGQSARVSDGGPDVRIRGVRVA